MAGYQGLSRSGELSLRARRAQELLAHCTVCPRRCEKNRLAGELGKCRVGARAWVASYGPHLGEEAPLVGHRGSGTIFFSHCNLRCIYCQNYTISHGGEGREVGPKELAGMMLDLQARGCHNINLVSPTHIVPQILAALEVAADAGLYLPLVYNTGGYDALETLAILDGVVDIYMPDMKYSDPDRGRQYSGVVNYPQVNRAAVKEMHRQVGDLVLDQHGVAVRGLLVRHLVLPNDLAGTEETFRFLAEEVSTHTYLNIMAQYWPHYRAYRASLLSRPVSHEEYLEAVELAHRYGLERLDERWSRLLAWSA